MTIQRKAELMERQVRSNWSSNNAYERFWAGSASQMLIDDVRSGRTQKVMPCKAKRNMALKLAIQQTQKGKA